MKTVIAACATVLGVAVLAGAPSLADERCPPGHAASGFCAPLHFIDDDYSRSELLRRRTYRYQEPAPPPDIALDGKEGYSQGYSVHQRYLDRDGRRHRDRDDYDRRYNERDDYDRRDYDRRYRRNDAGDVVTDILRALSN